MNLLETYKQHNKYILLQKMQKERAGSGLWFETFDIDKYYECTLKEPINLILPDKSPDEVANILFDSVFYKLIKEIKLHEDLSIPLQLIRLNQQSQRELIILRDRIGDIEDILQEYISSRVSTTN